MRTVWLSDGVKRQSRSPVLVELPKATDSDLDVGALPEDWHPLEQPTLL